jgi:hypothetical protein
MMKSKTSAILGVLLAALTASVAQAHLLVDFTPVTQTDPSVKFGPANPAPSRFLDEDVGFLGTGLGGSAGVHLRTPLVVTSVAGFSVVDGFTTWTDVSLSFSPNGESGNGLQVSAPASVAFGVINQPLGSGRFTFTSSAASGAKVLLTGTFDFDAREGYAAVISGLRNGTTGAILSGSVTYDGGAIHTVLTSIPGATSTGDATFNALLVVPRFQVDNSYLSPFTARVQGQFSTPVIPEPSYAMYILPATALLARRRRSI